MFPRAPHLSLPWTILTQPTPFHPICFRYILILSSRLRLGLQSGLFSFLNQTLLPYTSPPSRPLFGRPNYIWWLRYNHAGCHYDILSSLLILPPSTRTYTTLNGVELRCLTSRGEVTSCTYAVCLWDSNLHSRPEDGIFWLQYFVIFFVSLLNWSIGEDRFFPHSYQFIVHSRYLHSMWHVHLRICFLLKETAHETWSWRWTLLITTSALQLCVYGRM